jgi:hypothetical protein
MLLFRSEEHVDRWCAARRIERGEIFPLDQCWELARVWYADRLSSTWRRRTPQETESVFAQIGFRGPFWSVS